MLRRQRTLWLVQLRFRSFAFRVLMRSCLGTSARTGLCNCAFICAFVACNCANNLTTPLMQQIQHAHLFVYSSHLNALII